jgi:hypothetical protein
MRLGTLLEIRLLYSNAHFDSKKFGFSTIGVDTAWTGAIEYKFKYIKNADEFQEALVRVQQNVKNLL